MYQVLEHVQRRRRVRRGVPFAEQHDFRLVGLHESIDGAIAVAALHPCEAIVYEPGVTDGAECRYSNGRAPLVDPAWFAGRR